MTDDEYKMKQAENEAKFHRDSMRPINAAAEFNDAYWLRYFAAAAMQGKIVFYDWSPLEISKWSVYQAQSLLSEIKRAEAHEAEAKNEKA